MQNKSIQQGVEAQTMMLLHIYLSTTSKGTEINAAIQALINL